MNYFVLNIVVQKAMFKDGKLVNKIEPPGERNWASKIDVMTDI